ncbi:MAG: polyphosphate polymerase domain-containing protein [Firmicutes bacterium]|nr:polyphosphate polymerase domain-containing protein [Bacillota bacterium]
MELSRTELKFIITIDEYVKLKNQLQLIMNLDIHAEIDEDEYFLHSLYFDDFYDSRIFEKADGIEFHQKFRIRTYSSSEKRLEYKTKVGNMTNKQSMWISDELAQALILRDYPVLYQFIDEPLIQAILIRMKCDDLRPRLYVDYKREAYTYPEGDVRITFDKDICGYLFDRSISSKRKILEPRTMILEVKYTGILPDFIHKIVFYKNLQVLSYSKFYMSWLLLEI